MPPWLQIEELGGTAQAIEQGYQQNEIANAAYRHQLVVESRDEVIVGVNAYTQEEDERALEKLEGRGIAAPRQDALDEDQRRRIDDARAATRRRWPNSRSSTARTSPRTRPNGSRRKKTTASSCSVSASAWSATSSASAAAEAQYTVQATINRTGRRRCDSDSRFAEDRCRGRDSYCPGFFSTSDCTPVSTGVASTGGSAGARSSPKRLATLTLSPSSERRLSRTSA